MYRLGGSASGSFLGLLSVCAAILLVGGCGVSEGESIQRVARVRIRVVDAGTGHYVEGYLPTIQVTGPNGSVSLRAGSTDVVDDSFVWPLGHYRLDSWVEPCVGSCDVLDPPTDRCAATFELGLDGVDVTVTRRAGSPCATRSRSPGLSRYAGDAVLLERGDAIAPSAWLASGPDRT